MELINDPKIENLFENTFPTYKWDDLIKMSEWFSKYGSGVSPIATDFQSGNFKEGSAGWRLTSGGDLEANNGTFRGTLSATTGTIGAFNIGADYIRDVANSFGLSSTVTAGDDVRFWAGATFANRATAPFRVTEAGVVTASNIVLNTSVNLSGLVAGSEIAIQGWTHSLVFSVTDADTVAWTSGSIKLMDGTTYSISAGNTGNMSAMTYIYLDIGTSVTVLQTTTTATTAVGSGKILICVAQNGTGEASFIDYGSNRLNIPGTSIVAASLTSSELAAGAVTSAKGNLALRGWTQTCVFSATDADTVSWLAGILTSSDGTAYNIDAGNTGNMSARTYIYLDIAVSTTVYQVTTTAATAVGDGKLLIAVAENGTGEASFQVFGGYGGLNIKGADIVSASITTSEIAANTIVAGNIHAGTITATEIAANTITASQIAANTITAAQIAATTITANEIAANTITSGKMNVSSLSSMSANLGAITAGTITLDTSGYIRGGQTDYATGTGFFLGYSGGAYKFSIGNPAGSHFTWDGSNMSVTGGLKWGFGNILLQSADTQRSDGSATWTKLKDITIKKGGNLRIKFSLKSNDVGYAAYARVYKNGVAIGTQQSNSTTSYELKSEDITGWSAGDSVQLYVLSTNPSTSVIKEFRLYVDNYDSTTVVTD